MWVATEGSKEGTVANELNPAMRESLPLIFYSLGYGPAWVFSLGPNVSFSSGWLRW